MKFLPMLFFCEYCQKEVTPQEWKKCSLCHSGCDENDEDGLEGDNDDGATDDSDNDSNGF